MTTQDFIPGKLYRAAKDYITIFNGRTELAAMRSLKKDDVVMFVEQYICEANKGNGSVPIDYIFLFGDETITVCTSRLGNRVNVYTSFERVL